MIMMSVLLSGFIFCVWGLIINLRVSGIVLSVGGRMRRLWIKFWRNLKKRGFIIGSLWIGVW